MRHVEFEIKSKERRWYCIWKNDSIERIEIIVAMVHVEIWMHQTHDCLGLSFFLNCYLNVQIIKIKQLQVK